MSAVEKGERRAYGRPMAAGLFLIICLLLVPMLPGSRGVYVQVGRRVYFARSFADQVPGEWTNSPEVHWLNVSRVYRSHVWHVGRRVYAIGWENDTEEHHGPPTHDRLADPQ